MTKNRKRSMFARIGAMVLAAVMLVTYGMPASVFAAGTGEEKGTITVKNVDEKAKTVIAYKIVEPKLNKNGKVIGYKAVEGTDGVKKAFTADEEVDYTSIPDKEKLAGIIPADNGVPLTKTNGVWEKNELTSGIYLIKVETEGAVVYNPIIVGLSYDEKDKIADEEFSIPETADAKKQPVNVIKEATKDINSSGNKNGQDAQIGDVIEFKITAPIANYSDKYENITLNLGDTLDAGLTFVEESVKVEVSDEKESENPKKKITNSVSGQKLTVTATGDEWIKANGGNNIVVTYKAKLNDNAKANFNANKNSVEYTFSNNPYNSDEKGTSEDHTYHYTFEIDGLVGGTLKEKSHEFIKTGDQIEKATSEITKYGALEGAVFALYDVNPDNEDAQPIMEGTSNKNGLLEGFKGLDANKTYYLVETSAPAPYMVNDAVTKIMVKANYNANGTLNDYQFVINDDKVGQKFTATYENEAVTEINTGDTKDNHFEFVNTKTPKLPSTGGMGTYIFTILGVAFIAVAAGMHFRKKEGK